MEAPTRRFRKRMRTKQAPAQPSPAVQGSVDAAPVREHSVPAVATDATAPPRVSSFDDTEDVDLDFEMGGEEQVEPWEEPQEDQEEPWEEPQAAEEPGPAAPASDSAACGGQQRSDRILLRVVQVSRHSPDLVLQAFLVCRG